MEKRYYVLFVDAQNYSWKNFSRIERNLWKLEPQYKNAGIYCFGLNNEKDGRLKKWKEVTEGKIDVHWEWLAGKPQKNKVDNAIIESIESLLDNRKVDEICIFCLAASDGDYVHVLNKLKAKGIFTIVFGKENASEILKSKADMFKPWDEKRI